MSVDDGQTEPGPAEQYFGPSHVLDREMNRAHKERGFTAEQLAKLKEEEEAERQHWAEEDEIRDAKAHDSDLRPYLPDGFPTLSHSEKLLAVKSAREKFAADAAQAEARAWEADGSIEKAEQAAVALLNEHGPEALDDYLDNLPVDVVADLQERFESLEKAGQVWEEAGAGAIGELETELLVEALQKGVIRAETPAEARAILDHIGALAAQVKTQEAKLLLREQILGEGLEHAMGYTAPPRLEGKERRDFILAGIDFAAVKAAAAAPKGRTAQDVLREQLLGTPEPSAMRRNPRAFKGGG